MRAEVEVPRRRYRAPVPEDAWWFVIFGFLALVLAAGALWVRVGSLRFEVERLRSRNQALVEQVERLTQSRDASRR